MYILMGCWTIGTGTIGLLANLTAISLFFLSDKVKAVIREKWIFIFRSKTGGGGGEIYPSPHGLKFFPQAKV